MAAGAALVMPKPVFSAAESGKRPNSICAFIKFLQSMSYDELADAMASSGFDGIEATVRSGGYIAPERAPDELPKLVEALDKRGLKITLLATDIAQADERATRVVLKTASDLGISMYRLGPRRYDLRQPVTKQLDEIRPQLAELASLNRELGIQGVYQNHSGADMVGAAVWDIFSVIKDLPVADLALAFDIRHAAIEAGLAWPAVYNAVRPHIGAVFVKDFDWRGRRAEHVPLGDGRVDREFFQMLERDDFRGPISLHVEYLGDADASANLAALQRDLATLRGWL
jgi:sugar phosphate isomerase/epimerase